MKTLLLFIPFAILLSGCMRHNPQIIKETDANKKVVLSFFNNAFNEKNPVKSVNDFTNNVEALSAKGDTLRGRSEIADSISSFLNSFSSVSFKSEWSYAEGEMVIVRWVITCTPKDNYLAYPAGHQFRIRGASFLKLFERKIYSSVTYWNFK
ncbi:MAG: ester cyclase [Ignavibacteriaceae bacterium]|nr:ester cyclase [Ignavibacteriaceae bacterium]